jgi:hypothetical protein
VELVVSIVKTGVGWGLRRSACLNRGYDVVMIRDPDAIGASRIPGLRSTPADCLSIVCTVYGE